MHLTLPASRGSHPGLSWVLIILHGIYIFTVQVVESNVPSFQEYLILNEFIFFKVIYAHNLMVKYTPPTLPQTPIQFSGDDQVHIFSFFYIYFHISK